MKNLFEKVLFLALLLTGMTVNAQRPQPCATDELHDEYLRKYPELGAFENESERAYREFIENHSGERTTGGVQTIPVVFHVIQTSTVVLVTDADLQSQIDVLNEDFRKLAGTPGDGAGVDTKYEFCLASIDPNGCPSTGINRIVSPGLAYHDRDVDETNLKGLIQWDPNMYLNVWVPRTIETAGAGGQGQVIGYATFPTWMPFASQNDGIVVHSGYIGRDGDPTYRGRTATHEVGHWLGLYHTFQGGCSGATANTCASQGDRVCDTPQAAEANFNCPSINSCTDSPTDLPDQIENYMDYADGVCQNMFTAGQKTRIDYHVSLYRGQLSTPANLSATGCDGTTSPGCVPQPDFLADNLNSCVGQPISFSDLTAGIPTSWSWTFTGGNPATSTDQNPTVVYTTPGTYTVSLTATNALGTASETKNGYITISESSQPPLVEGFESILFLPQGWSTEDEDQVNTWQLVTDVTASEGTKCMKMKNFESSAAGTYDALNTKLIDLSWAESAEFTFDHAYRKKNGFDYDTLMVRVSDDCGTSWTKVWEKGGPFLATVGGIQTTTEFKPSTAAQWVSDTISLDSFVGKANVKIQFRNISGDGQSLYLDNINMSFTAVSVKDATQTYWSLKASPNPFTDELNVSYELAKATEIEFSLTDMTGKALFTYSTGKQPAGVHQLPLGGEVYRNLPAGIYFLKGTSEHGSVTRKLVKQN